MSIYDEIRKDFYKKHDESEIIGLILSLAEQRYQSLDYIDNFGPNTTPITSDWFDDILYKAKRVNNDLSPADAMNSDECIQKILNYVKSKPKFFTGDDITNIKSYFRNSQSSVVNATKVANFSPNAARKIYERYCPIPYATVLDYSCGFGARMLGCLSSPYQYRYVGIEPNIELNDRLGEFSQYVCNVLNRPNNTVLYKEGSEVFHEELVNTVDISFSSPPYFNLEIYSNDVGQSAQKDTSYNAWKNNYMLPTLKNIFRYTKQNGLHIVNLKNLTTAGREPLLNDWYKAAVSVGFKPYSATYLTHQSRRQFDKNSSSKTNFVGDKEPIIIFKKG